MKSCSTAFSLRQALAGMAVAALVAPTFATTPLADQPVFTTISVPGNLALALSVEFPTAISVAHTDTTYDSGKVYLGYFDPNKCYLYSYNATETLRHFYPAGLASDRKCNGADDAKWSGNFMNWATMQTVDPFRWALTGGYRSTDTATETILEKAYASNQGSDTNFPNRTVSSGGTIADATPVGWGTFKMRVRTLGNKLRFSESGDVTTAPIAYNPGSSVEGDKVYEVSVRVKVCDSSAAAGGLEANCTKYPAGNYKPTGLIQQYADQIRYSAFGYLNDSDIKRDGGVLRAQQKFVGPTQPVPGSTPIANSAKEWDSDNGVMAINPNATDASDTATLFGVPVANSGVMNYLNKFGQVTPGTYKTYDPVGELYYAAIRYFKNLGNVPSWTARNGAGTATKTTWVDGFPVIENWNDPIQYSCQKNFVLGIGDVNTHADRNVPGTAAGSGNEPTKPSFTPDPVDALVATNKVGSLHGLGASLGATQPYGGCCNNNGALMAGLAYDANAKDIRPDVAGDIKTKGRQTVQTYWLDILEYSTYKKDNQFYLAAKYGGFTVPEIFDPYTRTTDIPEAWWYTTTDMTPSPAQKRPDTYFTAARPDQMVAGLTKAFASIASKLSGYSTSFSTSLPQVASLGVASYATQYDPKGWGGELAASTNELDAETGTPAGTETWRFTAKLEAQLTGTGWDTSRVVTTYNTDTNAGVPFRIGSLSASQVLALDTAYRTGDDSTDYLNYLRGERKHEKSSPVAGSAKAYRDRVSLVGDIVGSKARPVGRPDSPYSSAANPGYGTFKTTYATRKTMVYVGTNQGVLHAVDGALTGTGGQEVFAYVPGPLYQGPTGTPATNGLQALGNPDFVHYNFVDATPLVADVDFGRTNGNTGTDWRTILVGGLGKGGRGYYAIDVTNPAAMTSEAAVASKVLWEISSADPDFAELGFTYGEPALVKTRKWDWVLIFGSGYNNADGKGYFFFVNPRTGKLLEKISTGIGSSGSQAGLAHVQAFMLDRTDGTADTVYAGDLLGNLWRLDVTAATGAYPAPLKMAELTDSAGLPLAVTSRPLVVIQPGTLRRYVTVGTGRLLHPSDSGSTQAQRFFAIIDGTNAAFYKAANLPGTITFPIQRSNLKELTDLTQKPVFDLNTEIGWFVDLGRVAGGPGWRVISDSASFFGIVAFPAMAPSTDSACEPSGTSRVYAIDLGTGSSRLQNGNSLVPFNNSLPGVITDLRFYSVAGKPRLLAGSDTGAKSGLAGNFAPGAGLRRLNWREVPLND